MSRRLTISSLLCDDDPNTKSEPQIVPEPVLLAPHLRRSPHRVETVTPSQPTTVSASAKLGLDALVHAAAEERSRLPSSWSSSDPSYGYSPEDSLQRHQQQLEQRLVHREQILGYNDTHRHGRKSDPLPGPGMRNIMGPTVPSTPGIGSSYHSVSPTTTHPTATVSGFSAEPSQEHLHKKRRYSDDRIPEFEHPGLRDESDRYRQPSHLETEDMDRSRNRASISALTSPTVASFTASPPLPSRRTGYDPVHENDHNPAYNNPRFWGQTQRTLRTSEVIDIPERDVEMQVEEERADSTKRARTGHSPYPHSGSPYQERPLSRSDAQFRHQYNYPTSAANSRSPHFQHDHIRDQDSHGQYPQRDRDSYGATSQLPASFGTQSSHSRDPPSAQQQQYRVISPTGRRSPPGSQAGRAIAAKKVEQEHYMPIMESVLSPEVKREVSTAPHAVQEPGKRKEKKTSRTKELPHSSFTSSPGPVVKPEISTSLPPSPPVSSAHRQIGPPTKHQQDDPHEWFLEQYTDGDDRRNIKRPHSSIAASSPVPAVPPASMIVNSDSARRSTASPVASKPAKNTLVLSSSDSRRRDDDKDGDDAMMALEQELDAELAGVVQKPPSPSYDTDVMDVDVDQAVAELVDETLGDGAGDVVSPNTQQKQIHDEEDRFEATIDMAHREDEQLENDEDKAMDVDVDVEDELLSLLDERPNSRMSAAASIVHNTTIPSIIQLDSVKAKASKNKASPVSHLKNEEMEVSPHPVSPSRPSSAGGTGQSSARPLEDNRESMPPPLTLKDKPDVAAVATQPKRKGKPGPKPKPRNLDGTIVGAPLPKPRAKPGPKPKPRDEFGNIIRTPTIPVATAAVVTSRATSSATPAPPIPPPPQVNRTASGSHSARSRSTSVLPSGSVDPEGEAQDKMDDKEDDKEEEDDKLYCLCKTTYDEDKPMIACDSCDEWYHMKCVEIPEHKGDLVDQFFCPLCAEKNPSAQLKTTYKQRCLFGLNSPDPESPKACHKPARTFSKYCSEGCGVKNLRKRIDGYTKKGGKKEDLWDIVKTASKREGLVRVIEPSLVMKADGAVENDIANLKPVLKEIKPSKSKQEREIERLNGLLADIEKVRDELRRGMDILLSREKLLQLASDRSENLGQCGWDQRLCFSDEDWADYGEGVLESYTEQGEGPAENGNGEEPEWWCPGDQDCERHAGWQSLRAKDVDKEKEKKEEAIFKLTSREREIRKRIDRIEEQEAGPLFSMAPRKGVQKGSGKLSNGHPTKNKVNGDISKKGKKRKVPS
ncbi:hypothetical protein GYMLUDRAFT_33157 [Collybiopsis luxurians FD-317 M1]|nr:hypothetical protein GYMLUDRAFT_33157 [Collybiopsis luxurians FD-317 M1]